MRVLPGDLVEAGDIIAIIPQDGIIAEIEALRAQSATQAEIEAKIAEYQRRSFVLAPSAGRVTRTAEEKAFADAGDEIATILVQNKSGADRQVLAFVPSAAAKNLLPGMEAQISPTFAPREEYGYINGYISAIGSYPVTRDYINPSMLAYVEDILPESGFIEVTITLLPDAGAANLLKWSSERGRSLRVDVGTACRVMIVTNKSRPIDRVF
jgi:hypothetical protein